MNDADFEAVVYDLDGTVVRLTVNWATVATDVIEIYETVGVDAAGEGLWELLENAESHGIAEEVEEAINSHERTGAKQSERLPLAADLAARSVPVGICSLNCEQACRIALETHGLSTHVDAVVGRDSVRTHKPDPEPLLATLDRLGVDPANAVFIGDSPRDEVTADRAGVQFSYVE